eukprot:CAMPEP_0176437554 /NCGR_PEP_ID=MMETSP0127-20121128/18702_1 /TAXON_ID=938130 /ORGANISM="Platyophrya macrostoma, Strain WH" /LENGTH=326 /DNA_ID=CAMNT_0017821225 /DNA_START=22 /DNA_END=1002 /DNA_ORIENTATION=-
MRLPAESNSTPIELDVVDAEKEVKHFADVLIVLSPNAQWEVSEHSLLSPFKGMSAATFAHVQRSWFATNSFRNVEDAEKAANVFDGVTDTRPFPFVVCDGAKSRNEAAFGAAKQLKASLVVVPPVAQSTWIPSILKSTPSEALVHESISNGIHQCGIWIPRSDTVELCSVGPLIVLLDLDRLAFRQPPLVAQLALKIGNQLEQPVHFLGYFSKPLQSMSGDTPNEGWMEDLKMRRAACLETLGTVANALQVPGEQMHLCDEDPLEAVCSRLPSMTCQNKRPLVCFARYPSLLFGQRASYAISYLWRDQTSSLVRSLAPLVDVLVTV